MSPLLLLHFSCTEAKHTEAYSFILRWHTSLDFGFGSQQEWLLNNGWLYIESITDSVTNQAIRTAHMCMEYNKFFSKEQCYIMKHQKIKSWLTHTVVVLLLIGLSTTYTVVTPDLALAFSLCSTSSSLVGLAP